MKNKLVSRAPFADLPLTPAVHFRLVFYAAVLRLLEQALDQVDKTEALYERFPFLIEYNNELAQFGLQGMTLADALHWWEENLSAWEAEAEEELPLAALRRAAGLDSRSMTLWVASGLIEEDARFGAIFELLNGLTGQPRPTLGLLQSWWMEAGEGAAARRSLSRLQELGLLETTNPDSPRLEWGMQVPGPIWDALRGPVMEGSESDTAPVNLAPGLVYCPPGGLTALDHLILPVSLRERTDRLRDLLASEEVGAVIVRGPQHNGQRTLLGALARSLGLGRLEIQAAAALAQGNSTPLPVLLHSGESGGPGWRLVGPLATLLRAMPVITLDLLPGERAELPLLPGWRGPLGIALGQSGAVSGVGVEQAVTLTLDLPSPEERRQHWSAALGSAAPRDLNSALLDGFAEQFRLTGGNIRRAARMACAIAALDRRSQVSLSDVRQAEQALNRQALETLAQYLEPPGGSQPAWSLMAVDAHTQSELITLESRCRSRERLPQVVGAAFGRQLNCGVRALFSGPSGTGKTLAARLLAAALQKDLYRLDLSAVVNKYIGETEKNLNQAFARAEELDVVLLIDEGDALLTQRTAVNTSNDRYANLETNYLLQRIESYQGILIVTTNAADRIDTAFQRRMDVVVEFHSPDPSERYAIWQMHLPLDHRVPQAYLEETAVRCPLTGGQIRNAVLHAALLAINGRTVYGGEVITSQHLFMAVEREYRKTGSICPLPNPEMER